MVSNGMMGRSLSGEDGVDVVDRAPVEFVAERGMWWVSSHALVREAASRTDVFSSDFGAPQTTGDAAVEQRVATIREQGYPDVPTLLNQDPPGHDKPRKLVRAPFGARAVAALEPAVRDAVTELVDAMLADTGDVEFVAAVASPLPLRIIAAVLGVPIERLADFARWSKEITRTIGADLDDDGRIHQAEQTVEFERFFAGRLTGPGAAEADGLVDVLRNAVAAEDLTMAEAVGICRQILVAGNETTAKLLGTILHTLATDAALWEWLRADPDARATELVEEGLRLYSPVAGMLRIATADVELGGVTIPQGARVMLSYAAANRDPEVYADPDRLNVGADFPPSEEKATGHMAFGHGVHYCLGAELARVEARIALATIARRVETVTLAPDKPVRRSPSFVLQGVDELWLRLTAAPS